MTNLRKKLIEVALPLTELNEATKPETENPFLKGHPRAMHNWWARTPLSMCRAILFAQLVDDPGDGLDADHAGRAREPLMDLVRRIGTWEATKDPEVLREARDRIKQQFGGKPPAVWDLFAGRGSISMEALRLGLEVHSSDLNPVAVTIQKALLDYPQRFVDMAPVNPGHARNLAGDLWNETGTAGLAEDIRYYGRWVRDEAEKRIGQSFPKVQLADGARATVKAWLWARTVVSPNPAAKGARVPLVRSFLLSSKKGRRCWVVPIVDRHRASYHFTLQEGDGSPPHGTISRGGGKCLITEKPIPLAHIRAEGMAGRIGYRLMATIIESKGGRTFLAPTNEMEFAAEHAKPRWRPDTELPNRALGFRVQAYGMTRHSDLFTPRQLLALTTCSDLIHEARKLVQRHWEKRQRATDDNLPIAKGGKGPRAYSDAIATYLACALSRMTDYHCSLATWNPTNENTSHLFQRQAIPMAWDFAEANPVDGRLDFSVAAGWVADALRCVPEHTVGGDVFQFDATSEERRVAGPVVVSTDPPYYDNIGYADLSDFFYVWLRRPLRSVDPDLFRTVLTPKAAELIASPYRHHDSTDAAKSHFRDGFASVFRNLQSTLNPAVPMTVYYAFKQSETLSDADGSSAIASTGWETMLEGLLDAGFAVTGTWPVRTTKKSRAVARNANALASAIVIVCRRREEQAPIIARLDFRRRLARELVDAADALRRMNIPPVDLRQAAIGPGMAVFSRYAQVLGSDGTPMSVRQALVEINRALDETVVHAASDVDADTRFCVAWFEQYGTDERPYGEAEVLFTATITSFDGLSRAGVLVGGSGKVRLRRRDELGPNWSPDADNRITDWECVQHLVRSMTAESGGGVERAARLATAMGPTRAETARNLAYRLHAASERKGWTAEALAYNILATSWPQIQSEMARQATTGGQTEIDL